MKDEILDLINKALELGADYAEIRFEDRNMNFYKVKKEDTEATIIGKEKGVYIRVLKNGTWGMASTTKTDKQTVTSEIRKAIKMAQGASKLSKIPVRLAEIKPQEAKIKPKIDKDPRDISPEEKISDLIELSKAILGYSNEINNTDIDYADIYDTRYYANTDGAYIKQTRIYVWSKIIATAKKNGVITSARHEIGSTKGYIIFDKEPIDEVAEKLGKRLKKQLNAKAPKGGEWPAVLGPEVVGVFTHEAFGHLGEADLAYSGAVTSQKIGQQIASKEVTIIDDGTIEGAFGSFEFDDEGVKTQKTVLVKDGVLVSFMYNREYAAKFEDMLKLRAPHLLERFNASPTGNARAENFRFAPIIRMRNTYIEPRDMEFEELFEDIKFGYYFVAFRGGQANLDGTFQVGIQEAYEIINGEIGEPVRNVSISGNTLETLMKVEAVGKDFKLHPGRCGKGQTAYVGDGGPHIRVSSIRVGGES